MKYRGDQGADDIIMVPDEKQIIEYVVIAKNTAINDDSKNWKTFFRFPFVNFNFLTNFILPTFC